MRVLIAIPCMDSVPVQFCQSLAMLNKVGECTLCMQSGSLIYDARNKLAAEAIRRGTDFVFWLDSDMVFAPDLLERLMQTLTETGADVVTGVYYRRQPPYSPVLFDDLEEDGETVTFSKTTTAPTEVASVAGCGFGAVLMKTEVLLGTLGKTGGLFAPFSGLGEDLAFCLRARRSGYTLVADPGPSLGHVGHMVVTRQFYETFAGKEEA